MITVRTAGTGDIPRIIEIAGNTVTPAWTYAYIAERLGRDDTLLLVAQQDYVVGFAAFRQAGDDGELLQIAVDKGCRRTGTGSLLLGAVLSYASQNGLTSVFLEARAANSAAISFYIKHGFEQIRIRKDYYSDPLEDAIVMVKYL